MPTEEQWRARLNDLLAELRTFPDERIFDDQTEFQKFDRQQLAFASGWLSSAAALAAAILPLDDAPHRAQITNIVGRGANAVYREQMMRVGSILQALERDIDAGLFRSVAEETATLVFSDWLDHAAELLAQGHKDIAGVVAGVAFEDTLRRIRAVHAIEPPNIKLNPLIVELGKAGALTALEQKDAIAGAGLRTSAAHARWDEFDGHQVQSAIELTRRFLRKLSP